MVMAALIVSSCQGDKFRVEGTIANAADSVLYFENMSLDGPVKIDSVRLAEDGRFSFSAAATNYPEFYRLRIAGQIINVAVDSTETVTFTAQYPNMSAGYEVSGSEENEKIRELALKQIGLQERVFAIARNISLPPEQSNDSITALIEQYKDDVKRNYIFKAPMRAYAYFALFQAIGNRLIFNPRESREDIRVFAAVATSWDTYYPESERGKNLHNITIEGMKTAKIVESQQQGLTVDANKVQETGIIDINLPDNRGVNRKLSDLKGRTVLVFFHVFASKGSTERIMELRRIYNKYHDRGFDIYLISLDADEHFWKEQTAALPWVNVRDENGPVSQYVSLYNVQSVPAYFLIDKTSTLKSRDEQIKDLDAAIEALL